MTLAGRRIVGLVTLVVLVLIGAGVAGIGPPAQRADTGVHQVRAVATTILAEAGDGLPDGSELAFLALDPAGTLVVSDVGRTSVLRFDPAGHLLTEWGPRFGGATLETPAGVAAVGDTVYVLDRGSPRVLGLDLNGRLRLTLSLEPFGTYGLNGLAADAMGNLYVADTGRNRILVFSPSGALLRTIGRPGSDLGGLTQPMMVAFAPDGGLAIADWENSRIALWSASVVPTATFSTGFHPFGVAVDSAGRVYVPDTARRKIVVFAPDGTLLTEIGGLNAADVLGIAPRQLVVGGRLSVYVLGAAGLARLDLEETPEVVRSGGQVDVLSLVAIAAMLGLVVVAFAQRRARRQGLRGLQVGSASNGPVGLDAKDGAERQNQQPRGHEDLLVAHQAEREQ